MAKIVNTAGLIYSNQLNTNSLRINALTKDAASGLRSDLSVVNNIRGLKSQAIAKIAPALIKQSAESLNIINIASTVLEDIENVINSIQMMLLNIDNADALTLQALQEEYINKVSYIIDTLNFTEFYGIKLFDGRLADPTGALPSEALPLDAFPFEAIVNTNYNNKIRTSIPRLLAGDGSVIDVDAPGRFTPLFPWNPAALASIITITNTIDATIGVNPFSDPSPAAQAANTESVNHGGAGIANNAGVAGVYGRPDNSWISQGAATEIQNQIENAKNFGANVFVNAIFNTAKAVISLGPIGDPVLMKNAIITLAQTADVVGSTETIKAINDIDIILTAAINIPGDADHKRNNLEPVINAISVPADTSPVVKAIYNVVKSVASSKFITSYPSLEQMKVGAVEAAKAATSVNPGLAAGDILTPTSRAAVKSLLEQALLKINTVQADLMRTRKTLNVAVQNLQIITIQHEEEANSLLKTDYSKVISSLLEFCNQNKVLSLGFLFSEIAINRIFEKLIALSKTLPDA